MLIDAYLRRQAHFQRSQAVHVLNAYAEMMNAGKDNKPQGNAPKGDKVDSGSMWDMLGKPKRKKAAP